MASEAKLERLMNLTAALVDAERPLTAIDIQQRVAGYASGKEAFRRTFERDKDELRSLGVPIEVRPVPGTFPEEQGYFVDRSRYEMPDVSLDLDELAALRLALESIGLGDPGDTVAGALRRLGGEIADDDRTLAPETALIGDLGIDPAVVPLHRAIAERRTASFSYRRGDESAERSIEPWSLGLRRGHWYVEGLDRDRAEPRQFRLDRIDGSVRTGEPDAFEVPADVHGPSDRAPWRFGGGEAVTAIVRITPEQSDIAAELLGPRCERSIDPDGWSRFEVEVTNTTAFRSFVLGFLDGAELVGPPELRAEFIEWLGAIAEAAR